MSTVLPNWWENSSFIPEFFTSWIWGTVCRISHKVMVEYFGKYAYLLFNQELKEKVDKQSNWEMVILAFVMTINRVSSESGSVKKWKIHLLTGSQTLKFQYVYKNWMRKLQFYRDCWFWIRGSECLPSLLPGGQINLLISLSAKIQTSLFLKMSNYFFMKEVMISKLVFTHGPYLQIDQSNMVVFNG